MSVIHSLHSVKYILLKMSQHWNIEHSGSVMMKKEENSNNDVPGPLEITANLLLMSLEARFHTKLLEGI